MRGPSRVLRRSPQRHAGPCVLIGSLAVAIAVAACGGQGSTTSPSNSAEPIVATAAPATASTSPLTAAPSPATPDTPPALVDAPDATVPRARTLRLMERFSTDFPQGVVVESGSIWTANENLDTLTRIDVATGRVSAIKVGAGVGPQRVVVAADAIWTAGKGGMVRVDPASGTVTARLSRATGTLIKAFGSLWGGEMGAARRVDPASAKELAEIPAGGGDSLCAVSSAAHSVWLGCGNDLYRVDPATNTVVATLRNVGFAPIVVGEDPDTWVIASAGPYDVENPDETYGAMARLDAATTRLIPSTAATLVRGAGIVGNLADAGIVWLTTSFGNGPGAGRLFAFDPHAGKVLATFDIGEGKGHGSNALTLAYGSLWTASGSANAVRRFVRPTP